MMSNKIYTMMVDSNLDSKLLEFQRQLKEGEEIIAQSTVPMPDGKTKLIITTKEVYNKNKNLLLEELQAKEGRTV
jgi:hypothetical protein